MALEVLLSDKLRSKANTWEPKVTWKSTALGHKKCSTCVVWARFFPLTPVSDVTELGVAKGLCWPKISEGLINDESLEGEGKTDVWTTPESSWRQHKQSISQHLWHMSIFPEVQRQAKIKRLTCLERSHRYVLPFRYKWNITKRGISYHIPQHTQQLKNFVLVPSHLVVLLIHWQ